MDPLHHAFYARYLAVGHTAYALVNKARVASDDRLVLLIGELENNVNNSGFAQYLAPRRTGVARAHDGWRHADRQYALGRAVVVGFSVPPQRTRSPLLPLTGRPSGTDDALHGEAEAAELTVHISDPESERSGHDRTVCRPANTQSRLLASDYTVPSVAGLIGAFCSNRCPTCRRESRARDPAAMPGHIHRRPSALATREA
jgi:hypothetical protein